MWFSTFLVILGFVPLVPGLENFPGQSDLVTSLPNVTFPIPYKQYAGYLDLEDNIKYFYWLFESQSGHPESDPVVQWLNGGPMASGLFGAFTELGPIRIEPNGSFTVNPYAWNLKANLLVIESPVDVGFSYKRGIEPNTYPNNDAQTAKLNLQAIRQFYAKFPHLAANAFYITGESYAGRYIPQYSVQALKAKFPTNFKAVAIGNGYLDAAHAELNEFCFYHGITDDINDGCTAGYNELASCPASPSGISSCDGEEHMHNWFNQRDLRDALHIDANYTLNYTDVSGSYDMGADSMAANVTFMVNSDLKVIIYNGDLDTICNFVGDRDFTKNLGYKKLSFDAWTVDNYIGGYRTQYEKNLTFTTVRGAGHMVPMDQPAAALKMLNEFLLDV